jgi:hypothetical protein
MQEQADVIEISTFYLKLTFCKFIGYYKDLIEKSNRSLGRVFYGMI